MCPQYSQVALRGGSTHRLRDKMYFRLKWLHRAVQSSCLFRVKGSEIPLPYGKKRAKKDASSLLADEVKLVAHPVGRILHQLSGIVNISRIPKRSL